MADNDEYMKRIMAKKNEVYPHLKGRRAVDSPMRAEDRRSHELRRKRATTAPAVENSSGPGRRSTDFDIKQFDRDERVINTPGSGNSTIRDRAKVYHAPVVRRASTAAKVAKAEGILSKAGRWGKLGALALGAGYAAYKTFGGDK